MATGESSSSSTPVSHEIELDYGRDWRTIVGGGVSVAALAIALSVLWRTRREAEVNA